MKKILLYIFTLCFLFLIIPSSIKAQVCNDSTVRCSECDECGYCRGREAPGNWESCVKCLYPALPAGTTANMDKTLIIDPALGENAAQITPALGKYYTQLGCISNINSFTDPTAIGGVVNFTLNKLIFPIVGVLAFLSLIYGAFLMATAQSNPEQISKGKSYVVGALVGLVFVLGVIFIIGFIGSNVLKIPSFGQ